MIRMAAKHANVALFIPHAGCPHQCSFCNQRTIAGKASQPTKQDVQKACETAISSMKTTAEQSQIAFFGGSFTALPQEYMLELLESAYPYVKQGYFSGIRLSTRPDAVDDAMVTLLKRYGVNTIELGAQCMNDDVLALNERGHLVRQVEIASACIKKQGISLVLQMMTGLYGSSDMTDKQTAEQFVKLQPDGVRIYPTVVVEGTHLAELYRQGRYMPQALEKAVMLCAELLEFFEEQQQIPVIRLGLHAEQDLIKGLLAGPWHPSFRELCENRLFFQKALEMLQTTYPAGGEVTVCVHPRSISKMIGQGKQNLQQLKQHGYCVSVVSDESLANRQIKIISRK